MKENNNIIEPTKVTIFKNVFDSHNPNHVDIHKIFERIRTGKTSKAIIEQLENITDEKERDKLKKQLPLVCFSGEFSQRANNGVIKHSGYICLDFGHVDDRIPILRKKLQADKYTMACFLSPKRNGLKVIVKIPQNIENHEGYFEGLRLHFKETTLDDDGEIARGCFESYDPSIYVNDKSTEFNILVKPKIEVEIDLSTRKNRIKDINVIYERIKKWVEKQEIYEDGNKHRFLVAISSAANRFGLPQDFILRKLIEEYQSKASFVAAEDFDDIINRIYITYNNQFDISWLTDKGEMNDFNPGGPARDVIYLKDIKSEMLQSFAEGDSKGETTYFKTIDPHWSWKRGELNLMHGIPNHGKTTLMLQLCLIKSVKEGTKWGIFSPEQNPPIDFYKDLIHTYIGKSTEKYHVNQMSEQEYARGMDFINAHFFFVYPKDDSPTPEYINERFNELIIKHKVAGCIIDPFNQLDNDYGKNGRDDIYISSFLNKEKRFALINNIYKIIIAHPKGNQIKGKNNNYECPDVYSLAGGAMWPNKCDNILVTYRPYYNEDKSNPAVEFRSQKVKKQKYVGIPGTVLLHFDIFSNRYLEFAEQKMVNENGKSFMKYVGISPFDDDYLEAYDKKVLQHAGGFNGDDTTSGLAGLGKSNDITNQIIQQRQNASIPIPEISNEENYNDYTLED